MVAVHHFGISPYNDAI